VEAALISSFFKSKYSPVRARNIQHGTDLPLDHGAKAFEDGFSTIQQAIRKRKVSPPKAKDFTNQRTRYPCNRASYPHFEKAGANVRFLAVSSNS
jgi:hypothetical protein